MKSKPSITATGDNDFVTHQRLSVPFPPIYSLCVFPNNQLDFKQWQDMDQKNNKRKGSRYPPPPFTWFGPFHHLSFLNKWFGPKRLAYLDIYVMSNPLSRLDI